MKITEVKNCPPGLNYFDKDDLESKLEPQDIEDIVEIFQTPLTGSYNWDYTDADNRLKKLYELGKKLISFFPNSYSFLSLLSASV